MVLILGLTLAAVEAGYFLGKWRLRREHEDHATASATVGATLGLLAFTLGFTFAMAASRFDTRKQLALSEANAIGTTYLRALLLPATQAAATRDLLRRYVDARLEAAASGKLEEGIAHSERLQELLWRQAVAAGTQSDSVTTALFITSLNEVIDLHSERLTAWRNRIPATIWVFLFVATALGMASMGYNAGLTGSRRTVAVIFLTLSFSGSLALIADLDRPREGFLIVSQQAMRDLQTTMRADAQGSP